MANNKVKAYVGIARRKIIYENDVVFVLDKNDKEIYRGIEDYEPMKDAPWRWDKDDLVYRYKDYVKICYDPYG